MFILCGKTCNLYRVGVYPNPTVNYLQIDLENYHTKIFEAAVFNNIGMKVLSVQADETKNRIDVSELKPGIYFLRLQTTEGNKTVKFVKD